MLSQSPLVQSQYVTGRKSIKKYMKVETSGAWPGHSSAYSDVYDHPWVCPEEGVGLLSSSAKVSAWVSWDSSCDSSVHRFPVRTQCCGPTGCRQHWNSPEGSPSIGCSASAPRLWLGGSGKHPAICKSTSSQQLLVFLAPRPSYENHDCTIPGCL